MDIMSMQKEMQQPAMTLSLSDHAFSHRSCCLQLEMELPCRVQNVRHLLRSGNPNDLRIESGKYRILRIILLMYKI